MCYGLQDQKPEDFLNIMKGASLFGMPKLLACCEYYVALSTLAGAHGGLTAQCETEQLLARSWARIAKGFCKALQGAVAPTASQTCRSEPCKCECCLAVKIRLSAYANCTCFRPVYTVKAAEGFVPSPKEFWKMAEGDKSTQ